MAIYINGKQPKKIYYGSKPIKEVWAGSKKVWSSGPAWYFIDEFDTALSPTNYQLDYGSTTAGGVLSKNSANGTSNTWLNVKAPSDDILVRAIIGNTSSGGQKTSICIGSPSRYVYVEFGDAGGNLGEYNGSAWTLIATVPPLLYTPGKVVELARRGNLLTFSVGGIEVASANTTEAYGPSYRQVAITLRKSQVILTQYYSPALDTLMAGTI